MVLVRTHTQACNLFGVGLAGLVLEFYAISLDTFLQARDSF